MELILLCASFGVLVGIYAQRRGRDGWAWFLLSLCVTPVLTFIIVGCLPDKNIQRLEQKARRQRLAEEMEQSRRIEAITARRCVKTRQ